MNFVYIQRFFYFWEFYLKKKNLDFYILFYLISLAISNKYVFDFQFFSVFMGFIVLEIFNFICDFWFNTTLTDKKNGHLKLFMYFQVLYILF